MFFTYQEIDRTITENLRAQIVSLGHLPDITAYGTPEAYKAAKDAMRADSADKQLIEVFGVSAGKKRGDKTISKIVIDRKAGPRGRIGGFPATHYDKKVVSSVTTFTKYVFPDSTRDIRYEIRYFTDSAEYGRIISQAIEDSMGSRRYMNAIKDDGTFDPDKAFFIELDNEVDVSDDEMTEYVMTYIVRDVFLTAGRGTKLLSNIVPISNVQVKPDVTTPPIAENPTYANDNSEFNVTDQPKLT